MITTYVRCRSHLKEITEQLYFDERRLGINHSSMILEWLLEQFGTYKPETLILI